jgi:regulatory protein
VPTVTDIKPQKNGKRVNVYLDGRFGFGIDLVNLVILKIKIDSEFSQEEIDAMVKKAELQKVGDKLTEWAILRPRSEKEIQGYLKRKKVPESLHQDLFARMGRLGIIDDAAFAKWWVEQRLTFRSKSKRELVQELRLKGISSDVIDDVLAQTEFDESKSAKKLLEKNAYKWERYEPKMRKRKITEYLSRKGYSWDVIEKITSER